jgi:outer membrane lipoprotein-sorting protein
MLHGAQGTDGTKSRSISQIKTLEFKIREESFYNRNRTEIGYTLKFKLPDMARKEVLSPELNKGELYIYNKGRKMTWLPLFKQKKTEDIPEGENRIIDIFNHIFRMEKEDENFRREYYEKKLKGVKLGDRLTIEFHNYELCDGYLFPLTFTVKDKDAALGEIHVETLKINGRLDDKEFAMEE